MVSGQGNVVHKMGGQDDNPRCRLVDHVTSERNALRRVQADRWFVEDEHLWIMD